MSSRRDVPPPVVDSNMPGRSARVAPPEPDPPLHTSTAESAPINSVARTSTERPDMLASLLASSGQPGGEQGDAPAADPSAMLAGLVRLRTRQPEPMTDYVADGTRVLRWVQAAIAHQAAMTGRTQQEIMRDALLGIAPISPELLDVHYEHTYGRTRS